MSIRSKLTLSYVFLLLMVLAIGVVAFWAAGRWLHVADQLTRACNQRTAVALYQELT